MADISKIKLPNNEVHDIKDAYARQQLSGKADLSAISKVFVKNSDTQEYADGKQSDLSVIKVTNAEYYEAVATSAVQPNAEYIIDDEYEDAFGMKIKNLAPGTGLSDAVNVEQLRAATSAIADKLEWTDISAEYASQHIYLSAAGHVVGNIDCGDFIKDGMLSDVQLCSDQLIFIFNTDSGKQSISVQLSNFIDETKYYKKTETSSATQIAGALSNKQPVGSYVSTSIQVAGQQLTANVTPATISSAIGLDNYSLASHVHGNILNNGTLTAAGAALAVNDALAFIDASDSSKIKKTSITFDGATTNQFLSKKGTWGSALTAHQQLSSRGLSDWSISSSYPGIDPSEVTVDFCDDPMTPRGYDSWFFFLPAGWFDSGNTDINALYISDSSGFSASREQLKGYQLGDDTQHILAAQADLSTLNSKLSGYVLATRKVNGKALSTDITLNAANVSALALTGGQINGDLTVTESITSPYYGFDSNYEKFIFYEDGRLGVALNNGSNSIYVPDINVDDGFALSSDVAKKADLSALSWMKEVTWAELTALKANSQLQLGMQYRITDYVATTVQADTCSANKPFDIIVVADAPNKLNENARAVEHAGNTYFSSGGADPSKWSLKYCLENDTNKFAWADSTNGKGVIYWMCDEWENECPYDFKGLKMNSTTASSAFFTFSSSSTASTATDASLDGKAKSVYGNKMGIYVAIGTSANPRQLNRNVFKGAGCHTNILGNNCYQNTFNSGCYSNIFGNMCYFNNLDSSCQNNTFGNYVVSVSFGLFCTDNFIGSHCYYIVFYNYGSQNVIYPGCKRIQFRNASLAKNYYRNIIIESGNQYIYLYCSGTTSSSAYFQNVKICAGYNGTSTYKTITDSNTNQTYQTVYGSQKLGELLNVSLPSEPTQDEIATALKSMLSCLGGTVTA